MEPTDVAAVMAYLGFQSQSAYNGCLESFEIKSSLAKFDMNNVVQPNGVMQCFDVVWTGQYWPAQVGFNQSGTNRFAAVGESIAPWAAQARFVMLEGSHPVHRYYMGAPMQIIPLDAVQFGHSLLWVLMYMRGPFISARSSKVAISSCDQLSGSKAGVYTPVCPAAPLLISFSRTAEFAFCTQCGWFSLDSNYHRFVQNQGCTIQVREMGPPGKGKGRGKGKGKGTVAPTPFVLSQYYEQYLFEPTRLRIPQALRHVHLRPKNLRKMFEHFPGKWRTNHSAERTARIFSDVEAVCWDRPSVAQLEQSRIAFEDYWLWDRNLLPARMRKFLDAANPDRHPALSQTTILPGVTWNEFITSPDLPLATPGHNEKWTLYLTDFVLDSYEAQSYFLHKVYEVEPDGIVVPDRTWLRYHGCSFYAASAMLGTNHPCPSENTPGMETAFGRGFYTSRNFHKAVAYATPHKLPAPRRRRFWRSGRMD